MICCYINVFESRIINEFYVVKCSKHIIQTNDLLLQFQWDILSNGGEVQEMEHIANGRDEGNSVSLLRVNVTLNPRP